jgi:hypothetical protein
MKLDDLCGISVLLDRPHDDSGLLGASAQPGSSLEPMGRADRERLIRGNRVKQVHRRPRRTCERQTALEGLIASICKARRH